MKNRDATLAKLPGAALRALDEAQKRRQAELRPNTDIEIGGRDGPDPVRYGDWELMGRAIDF